MRAVFKKIYDLLNLKKKAFKDGKCIFQSFLSKILQMYLCFFLEISNVFMMSAFIAALDKKAKDIRINHLCIPLCSACRSGGWE